MPTTNTTQGSNSSTLQFNPIAQGIYNQLIQGGGNVMSGYMNDPFGNAAYRMGSAQSQAGAQQAGANNMNAFQQNMLTSGIGGQAGAGFKGAQLAQTGRANQAMSSQANIQNVMQAMQRQMQAAGTGLSFSPQLTGQTGKFNQSQTQSGLGTWLPQLLGGLASVGMGAATGGASSAMGAMKAFPGSTSGGFASMGNPGGGFGSIGLPMAGMAPGGLAGQLQSGGGGSMSPYMASMLQPNY